MIVPNPDDLTSCFHPLDPSSMPPDSIAARCEPTSGLSWFALVLREQWLVLLACHVMLFREGCLFEDVSTAKCVPARVLGNRTL